MSSAVRALAVLPNGDIVAGGGFLTAGGVTVNRIARWNGSTWSAFGTGMNDSVQALAVFPNGDLVAGGFFWTAGGVAANQVARWNGIGWSALGSGVNTSAVSCLAVLANGDLIAGGAFPTAGSVAANRIARWDGGAWSALGSGLDSNPLTLAVLVNGDLIAGGFFLTAGGVAASRIARWDGSAWSALGSGVGGTNTSVSALAVLPDGDLVAGGLFGTAGNQVSFYLARYATPCPATVASAGTACASSGGASNYSAQTLPWTGSTYRTRGTGLPSLAFVAVVTGFSATSIPLAAVLPPSPGGCTLLASPDIVDAVLTTTGAVDVQLVIANTPSLAGVVLHQQLVAIEVDINLSLVQNTSTNALTATIGSF